MKEWFRTGRSIMVVAAAWNILDALLHVAIDEIDLLRMAGNAVVLVATLLTYRPGVRGAIVAAVAAAIVAALNLAFFIDRGEVPVAAFVLVTVSLVLLGVAAWRFRAEEGKAGATGEAADA